MTPPPAHTHTPAPLPHHIQASHFHMQANEYALFFASGQLDLSQPINALGPCKRLRILQDSWVMYYV